MLCVLCYASGVVFFSAGKGNAFSFCDVAILVKVGENKDYRVAFDFVLVVSGCLHRDHFCFVFLYFFKPRNGMYGL